MQRRASGVLLAALALLAASLGALTPRTAPQAHLEPAAAAASVSSVLPRSALAAAATTRRCHAGLIALTFDDGPSASVTPRLVRTLVRRHVQATFFMVGSRIHTAPAAGRMVARAGFTIGNHTWSHSDLERLSDAGIRQQLRSTRREMRAHGIVPSDLMRPPYGAISPRVRADVRAMGLVPVLWTIDSRDWTGGTPAQIAARVLGALHRHGTNIVLQHDGVTNSPASVAAVPQIVRTARQRGYCFTHLGPRGGPVPVVRAPAPPTAVPAGRLRGASALLR